jgi:hypothetical protein
MNHSAANSNMLNDPTRCQHRTTVGKRCRLRVVDTGSGLCFRHASQRLTRPDADLRSALAGELQDFKSASEINDFLSRLLLLLSEDRVTPRRGAVLAYVCNLLLRTLPAMDRELDADSEDAPLKVDWSGIPRPDRDPLPKYSTAGRPQT